MASMSNAALAKLLVDQESRIMLSIQNVLEAANAAAAAGNALVTSNQQVLTKLTQLAASGGAGATQEQWQALIDLFNTMKTNSDNQVAKNNKALA